MINQINTGLYSSITLITACAYSIARSPLARKLTVAAGVIFAAATVAKTYLPSVSSNPSLPIQPAASHLNDKANRRITKIAAQLAPHSVPNGVSLAEAQQKLEEGIDISQDTITKIQQLMPKILRRADNEEITWLPSGGNLVFRLTSIPNLIFKMAPPNRGVLRTGGCLFAHQISESRFANMVKAVEVCTANRLNLLVVPHAKKFNVDGMVFIAEERVDINPNESAQEHLYQLSGLNDTARQLAIFIAKTGFSDVEWRNMPLIDTAPEFQGNRRVALVDLEEMDGAATGIFGGGLERRGLVGCLYSEAQIDIVLAEAQRQGIRSRYISPEQVKARRMEEIRSDQELQQFYMRNGILENARKPIQVDDLTTLDLNLEEQGFLIIEEVRRNGSDEEPSIVFRKQPITLRYAVVDVIAQINDAITKAPENALIKGKRYIFLNINDSRSLQSYDCLGRPKGKFHLTKEEAQQVWLRRIINALVAKGHLFKLDLDKIYGNGYFIQA